MLRDKSDAFVLVSQRWRSSCQHLFRPFGSNIAYKGTYRFVRCDRSWDRSFSIFSGFRFEDVSFLISWKMNLIFQSSFFFSKRSFLFYLVWNSLSFPVSSLQDTFPSIYISNLKFYHQEITEIRILSWTIEYKSTISW